MIETVTLTNGTEEAKPLVETLMMTLSNLMKENPIAFYELVECCRDREHQPFGNTADALKARSLMQPDGSLHDSIRNVITCAVEGDGSEMHLCNPTR